MAQGFFSGGFLNFVLDAQKKQKVMGQSIVESLTEEESPLASQEQQLESTTSIMKRRDWEWENYKKSESLTFEEDPEAVTKSGTQLKFKENAAKKKWQDNYFFTNKELKTNRNGFRRNLKVQDRCPIFQKKTRLETGKAHRTRLSLYE